MFGEPTEVHSGGAQRYVLSHAANEIRIFVSSTFIDFQEERSELATHVFPLLRADCEKRGGTFAEVDLRWGITEEESRAGRTIEICLEEVERCRPWFLGILGDRYGWVPEEWPPRVVDRFANSLPLRGRSVTELEIRHGVLANPSAAMNSRFYFRASRAATDPRQETLKQAIRDADLPVREGFQSPAELADWVREDFAALIAACMPGEQSKSSFEQEEKAQTAAKAHARQEAVLPSEWVAGAYGAEINLAGFAEIN